MRIVPGFIIREIAGEVIAIPTGDATHKLSGMVALNSTGKFLFELLQNETTKADLVDALLEQYEIDRKTAEADVSEFVELLNEHGFLV